MRVAPRVAFWKEEEAHNNQDNNKPPSTHTHTHGHTNRPQNQTANTKSQRCSVALFSYLVTRKHTTLKKEEALTSLALPVASARALRYALPVSSASTKVAPKLASSAATSAAVLLWFTGHATPHARHLTDCAAHTQEIDGQSSRVKCASLGTQQRVMRKRRKPPNGPQEDGRGFRSVGHESSQPGPLTCRCRRRSFCRLILLLLAVGSLNSGPQNAGFAEDARKITLHKRPQPVKAQRRAYRAGATAALATDCTTADGAVVRGFGVAVAAAMAEPLV